MCVVAVMAERARASDAVGGGVFVVRQWYSLHAILSAYANSRYELLAQEIMSMPWIFTYFIISKLA